MTRALAVAWFCLYAAPAAAEEAEKVQASALLAQGNALFAKGDLIHALAMYREAYARYPSPKLLVNAAAAERELGDLAGAANDLRRFLDSPDADAALVEHAATDLRALERRVGLLTLNNWPAQATLELDGKPPREPPLYVKPGAHAVRARALGEETLERTIEVHEGETVDLPRLLVASSGRGKAKRSRWWVPVVVIASLVVVGGAIGLGVGLTTAQAGSPLRSDLGTFKFSDFH
jgi:hypothetical protein